jgi:hypothetical protein
MLVTPRATNADAIVLLSDTDGRIGRVVGRIPGFEEHRHVQVGGDGSIKSREALINKRLTQPSMPLEAECARFR